MKAPKGTRDFLPQEIILRNKVFDIVRKVFESYGYEPLETPAFEYWEILSAKCGEEVKKEIYYFKDKGERELGLRFDLTVPFARVVASNPNLPKPFKRYTIGRVWRYEEPQKGRYREFWQADVDIAGSSSVISDAEVVSVGIECLRKLGFKNFKVRVNNRKYLETKLIEIGIPKEKIFDVFRIIDKLDKIGEEGVKELLSKVVPEKEEKIMELIKEKEEIPKEIEEFFEAIKLFDVEGEIVFDPSLVRGLDYYTGNIFEVDAGFGKSIAGGGRYDNLIGIYGKENVPAVGFSLGIERIIELIKERKMMEIDRTITKVFVANVGDEMLKNAIKIASKLRKMGIPTDINLGQRNLSKQLEYCNSKGIRYVLIVGEEEMKEGKVKLKDMESGEERKIKISELSTFFLKE